ncbi:hypothetical protein [Aneurinibacillus soli]|nr:hypothetical protein [Aneurinibacillus soli]
MIRQPGDLPIASIAVHVERTDTNRIWHVQVFFDLGVFCVVAHEHTQMEESKR